MSGDENADAVELYKVSYESSLALLHRHLDSFDKLRTQWGTLGVAGLGGFALVANLIPRSSSTTWPALLGIGIAFLGLIILGISVVRVWRSVGIYAGHTAESIVDLIDSRKIVDLHILYKYLAVTAGQMYSNNCRVLPRRNLTWPGIAFLCLTAGALVIVFGSTGQEFQNAPRPQG